MEKTVFIALIFIFAAFIFANEQFNRIFAFANAGDADSCYGVSLRYQYEKAAEWLEKAESSLEKE